MLSNQLRAFVPSLIMKFNETGTTTRTAADYGGSNAHLAVPTLTDDQPPTYLATCTGNAQTAVTIPQCFPSGGLSVAIDSRRIVGVTAHFDLTVSNTGSSDASVTAWITCSGSETVAVAGYLKGKIVTVPATGETKVALSLADECASGIRFAGASHPKFASA
eukprot:tig00000767_g3959.t1